MNGQKVTDHRVQVNLPQDLYAQVRQWAWEDKTSISEIVRQSLTKRVKKVVASPGKNIAKEKKWNKFIRNFVGGFKGYPDDSVSHDKWAHNTAVFHLIK